MQKLVILMVLAIVATLTSGSASALECEAGWKLMKSGSGSFCIQVEGTQVDVKTYKAAEMCESLNAKICSLEQWQTACNAGALPYQGWEWVITLDQYQSIAGRNGCQDIAFGELIHAAHLRCCRK